MGDGVRWNEVENFNMNNAVSKLHYPHSKEMIFVSQQNFRTNFKNSIKLRFVAICSSERQIKKPWVKILRVWMKFRKKLNF